MTLKSKYIYTGSIFFKRIGYIFLIFAIGLNLFFDRVQEALLLEGEDILARHETLAKSAEEYMYLTEEIVVPIFKSIEEWDQEYGATIFSISRGIEGYVEQEHNISSFKFPKSYDIEYGIASVREYNQRTKEYTPLFREVSKIIRFASILIWFPILVISFPWLVLDITIDKEKAKWVYYYLLISGPASATIYFYLMKYFEASSSVISFFNI